MINFQKVYSSQILNITPRHLKFYGIQRIVGMLCGTKFQAYIFNIDDSKIN